MRRAFAIAVATVACGRAAPPPPSPASPTAARVEPPIRAPAWIGVVVADVEADIAPPFEGALAEVRVRIGDRVTPGQVLAVLDPRPLREDLAAAAAEVGRTRAAARRAAVEVARARHRETIEARAVAVGAAPQVALDDARFARRAAAAAAAEARAVAAQARADRDRARRRLDATAITAPAAGTVAVVYRHPGEIAAPVAPVVRVIGVGARRLRFAAPAAAAIDLPLGAGLVVELTGIAAPVRATVAEIAPQLDLPSGLMFFEATLPIAQAATAPPGLSAWVRREAGR